MSRDTGPRRRVVDRVLAGPIHDAALLSCGHVYFLRLFGRWAKVKTTTCDKCRDGSPPDNWKEWKR